MALHPYKPTQGIYARCGAAAALLVLDLLAAMRLYEAIAADERGFQVLGLTVPTAVIWCGGLFVVVALIIGVLAGGLRTGIGWLDSKTQAFVDLMISMQAEMQKVAWPSKDELTRSTYVVLACILIMGLFLFFTDMIFSRTMQFLSVLPKPE